MERILSTIQKNHRLNEVWCDGEPGPGGGYHHYTVYHDFDPERDETKTEIRFQKGPRGVDGSIGGVTDQDLLEIVRDRLKAFQAGSLPSRETACALTHIEEALMWLNKRAEDRAERGVLGTYEK